MGIHPACTQRTAWLSLCSRDGQVRIDGHVHHSMLLLSNLKQLAASHMHREVSYATILDKCMELRAILLERDFTASKSIKEISFRKARTPFT